MKKIISLLKILNTVVFSFISLLGTITLINLIISNTQVINEAPVWTIIIGGILSYLCSGFMIRNYVEDSKRNFKIDKDFEDLNNQYKNNK